MAAPFKVLRVANFLSCQAHARIITRFSSKKSSDQNESHKVSGQSEKNEKLDLAKPGRARHTTARVVRQEETRPSSLEEEGLERNVVKAVDAVADAVSGDSKKLRSALLMKLQEQVQRSREGPQHESSSVSSLLSGMKVEKNTSRSGRDDSATQNQRQTPMPRSVDGGLTSGREARDRRTRPVADVRLFDGPLLGIFQRKSIFSKEADVSTDKSLFDVIEEEKKQKQLMMPPNNAFEEMIRWTREGKLWKFPVDNEQGMDAEARVGFHEHVFLDLSDFPKKGPIRHFMELVAVGLSKNPYFTAQEKREHIGWYAEYFKDKYHLIDDAEPVPPLPPSDSVQQLDK